mgnify:CR=1 FL=1
MEENFISVKKDEVQNEIFLVKERLKISEDENYFLKDIGLETPKNANLKNEIVEKLMTKIDAYFKGKTKDRDASHLILKKTIEGIFDQMNEVDPDFGESPMVSIQRLGLSRINYLILKALRTERPLFNNHNSYNEENLNLVYQEMLEIMEEKKLLDPDLSAILPESEIKTDSIGFFNVGNTIPNREINDFNENSPDSLKIDIKKTSKTDVKDLKKLELMFEETILEDPEVLLDKVKKGDINKKERNLLRKIVKEKIMMKNKLKSGSLNPNFTTVLEMDETLQKDVNIFDDLIGLNAFENELQKSGIVLSPNLSYLIKYSNILSKKQMDDLLNLPDFHFILEKNYYDKFWKSGKFF